MVAFSQLSLVYLVRPIKTSDVIAVPRNPIADHLRRFRRSSFRRFFLEMARAKVEYEARW